MRQSLIAAFALMLSLTMTAQPPQRHGQDQRPPEGQRPPMEQGQPQGHPGQQRGPEPGRGPMWQPQPLPDYVALELRTGGGFGGPMDPHTRSSNNAPTFFIYPDAQLDSTAAEALVRELDMGRVLEENFGTVYVINPEGAAYDNERDFENFKEMFGRARSGNLKVVGIGGGATFVNAVIAPEANGCIAGILTIGGKAGKLSKGATYAGVPAYIAGKNAAKVAKEYRTINDVKADGRSFIVDSDYEGQPLLKTYVGGEEVSSYAEVFADAWDKVLGRNFRYNNYHHTHYMGAEYGEYGSYELEPYTNWEALDIQRNVVEYGERFGGGEPWLWFEYWPKELMEGAAERSVPVVVLLHGNANDPRTQAETSGWIQVQGKERFFVVEMEWQGRAGYAAMGHDGIEQVLGLLLDKYPQLDPSRIYAEGLSAGSMTATALGIKKSHVFAAVGGHSGALFSRHAPGAIPSSVEIWGEATQKRGFVEMPYCSVFGTSDDTVPYVTEDGGKGNSYLNAWRTYQQMNGMEVVDELDFSVDEVFGQALSDRQTILTNKGDGIEMELGRLYKGDKPLIEIVAVMGYGHWNFMPTAEVMWDYFRHFSRDPETKGLVYDAE